jgi:UDP-glucose 4-epimerase
MNILVAGGAGYIGSHAVRRLLQSNHKVTILDNLSHGHFESIERSSFELENIPQFVNANINDEKQVMKILKTESIDAVMHFAAFIEVGESVISPDRYYQNNVMGSLSLLNCMRKANVKRIVFSSTAAVYGNPSSVPVTEEHLCIPMNPYGKSKRMVELILEDYASAFGFGYAVLRYFNVAGASSEGVLGETHNPESHLIPRVLSVASGVSSSISIYGTNYPTPDGTCIRDYIHVEDLVDAHLLALNEIQPGKGNIYNLGSENGFSVREVIETCERVTGCTIPIIEKSPRTGDPALLIASSSKIRSALGWNRRFPKLETIVSHAWNWEKRRNVAQWQKAA